MPYAETAAHGAVVKIGNAASPEVFTAIPGVHNGPTGAGWTPRIIEAIHHGSNTVKKYASFVDTGEITFSVYYDSTDTYHQALRDAAKNKTQTNFQVVYNEAGDEQFAFAAFVSFDSDADPEGWNVRNITLSINGDITVT